ncbi:prolyl 4-hydroxylase subunit alpha-2 [Lepeophtheirus salmonis]|uniref:prolyl 4-hydroxylase subunit alpha-2 n=1 Tax=Lepeophtheirus salmonis TaxID=72036 RepID=UPI001AE8204B|nr:prolyl 4-hydroxylase subunit alpha-2-like [Lepeophtheirus salmonis]
MILLIILIYFCEYSTPSKIELFSSSDSIGRLANVNSRLNNKIQTYLEELNQQISILDNFLSTYYDEYNLTESQADTYISNPINAFTLIKRTSHEWLKIHDSIYNETSENMFTEISELLSGLPNSGDIEGAANGLFLLQETYNLDIDLFAKGVISINGEIKGEMENNAALNGSDMSLMGKLAFNKQVYDRAYEWLISSLKKAIEDNDSVETISQIKKDIKTVIKYHDQILETRGSPRGSTWRTYVNPLEPKLASKNKYKNALKANNGSMSYKMEYKLLTELKDYEITDQFNALCRGEDIRDPIDDKDLSCSYLHFNDPYLKLGPFKLENLNSYPFIGVYHDFLYDNEMESFKSHSRPLLERSQHSGKKNSNEVSFKRTSKQTWLVDAETQNNNTVNTLANKISNRISYATKLAVKSKKGGEDYQIANYGMGGVYTPHMDSFGANSNKLDGDRLATVMAYLSDVEIGGLTVFPMIGIAIPPVKGTMVIWFNTDAIENQNPLTLHGGCPVISGSKWITNKWVKTYWQWKKFPCYSGHEEFIKKSRPFDNNYFRGS